MYNWLGLTVVGEANLKKSDQEKEDAGHFSHF